MLSTQILNAAIADRQAYEKVKGHFKSADLDPATGFWWRLVEEYYTRDKLVQSVDRAVLSQIGEERVTNPKHKDAIMGAMRESDTSLSVANIVTAVLGVRRSNLSAEFASAAMSGDDKKARKLLEAVNEIWQRDTFYQEERKYASSVEDIFNVVGSEKRITLSPRALNDRAGGGCLPGHHILIFGRTEVGKSAFAINMAAGFIRRGLKVLYVGNEDEINVTKARLISRLTKKTWADIERDKPAAIHDFCTAGGESNLRLVHLQPGSVGSLRKDVEEWSPNIVVVDQLRNMSGPEDGLTQRMEGNAIRFRNLISEYGLVGVSVTQAGDRSQRHGEDSPIWLSAGDVDSSRVGLPAQVDLMLGIGGNGEMIQRGQRAISLCKNKLASSANSREGFIVNVDLSRSIVK